MMRYDDDSDNFAAAVAASAHAILQSFQEANEVQITRTTTTKQHPSFRPPPAGTRSSSSSSSLRPAAMPFNGAEVVDQIRHKEAASRTLTSTSYSKADAWEKAHIAKIRKRYDKVHSDIQAWENDKKLREKQKLERRKHEVDIRRSRNVKHYERKIVRIDDIGSGARAQVDEKRKQQELIVKEKARKMRITGKPPVTCCFCF